jgi:PAS domain S-box-containing protein
MSPLLGRRVVVFRGLGLLVAFGIAVGSTLHNLLSTFLVKRCIGSSTTLSSERDVILFLLFGGPIACLVSATWGVTVLHVAGAVTTSQYWFSWWTWWVGDGTGVLIAAPIMLIAFAKPREIWSNRRITVGLPLLISCAVMVFTFVRASRLEQENVSARFYERARLMTASIKSHYDAQIDLVLLVERFLAAAPKSGRAEFSTFSAKLRTTHPDLQSVSWLMRIRDDERADFERSMVAQGFMGFTIKEISANDQFIAAKQRPEYIVTTFIEPYEHNSRVVGFDLASERTRSAALAWSRDRDKPTITAPLDLVRDNIKKIGVILLDPLYTENPKNESERRAQLRGFAAVVLYPETLTANALAAYSHDDYQLRLTDVTNPDQPITAVDSSKQGESINSVPFEFRDHWSVGGRTLEVVIAPTSSFLQANRSLQAWVVLAGGLGLCGLLGAFLLILSGRTNHIEQLVEQRTFELSAILDYAAEAIVTFDSDGAIERANPATARLFDYDLEKLPEYRVTDLIPQIDWNRISTTERRNEINGYRKDGSPLTLEMTLSRIDISGRVLFTCMLHDISSRKKAERLKNEFVSTVSHELRTPLTSISGSLALIAGGIAGDVSDDVLELVNIAKDNAGRLTLLVNDILDIEKLESGKLDVVCSKQDLLKIVQQALVQNHGYANRYGIEVKFDETRLPERPILVDVDPSRLLQVITNLLSNAIKFSPSGGSVEVSVEMVDTNARVAVRDQGPGIADDFRERIFEKFAQADGGDARARGGSGLGLSISKALVERLGGTIGFDSTPGNGSTFYFMLPIAKPSDEAVT